MTKKMILNGNEAAALAALLAQVQVCPEYEITPETGFSENLANYIARGKLKAIYIPVESEHSSLAAAIGASYMGARVIVGSSSHGTLLMHEMLHTAAGMRLPIVFLNVNRAVGLPWNIWTDQNDSLSQRDTGWIQLYCENSQETFDTILMAFKIGEHPEISLPVMVVTEGFILSHTGEVVEVPEQELVDKFLPKYQPPYRPDPQKPEIFGALTRSEEYFQMKIDAQKSMEKAREIAEEVDREFGKLFGRHYGIIERIHWQNPKIVLVTSGTVTSTARHIFLTEKGFEDVGLLKIKMFRPFPSENLREALNGVEKVIVIDRNISLGRGGIFTSELKSALYSLKKRPEIFQFVTGLGGVDITPELIKEAIDYSRGQKKSPEKIIWLPAHIEKRKEEIVVPRAESKEAKKEELLYAGHSACQGCGLILGLRHALATLGEKTVLVAPAGCTTLLLGVFPQRTLKIPAVHVNFGTGACSASGIRAAITMLNLEEEIENVLVWAGDGATFDIGFGALSAAAERGDDLIYICANNEAYMNTGIQRSSATPIFAWTTTTPLPQPKPQAKKPILEIMASHRLPYAATANIAYLEDFEEKLKKAKKIKGGLRFIELLVPCPTGWRFPSDRTIEIARLAVLTRVFPLYEVEAGEKWRITKEIDESLPVEEYLKLQGRFSHLKAEDIIKIQDYVEKEWQRLKKLCQLFQ